MASSAPSRGRLSSSYFFSVLSSIASSVNPFGKNVDGDRSLLRCKRRERKHPQQPPPVKLPSRNNAPSNTQIPRSRSLTQLVGEGGDSDGSDSDSVFSPQLECSGDLDAVDIGLKNVTRGPVSLATALERTTDIVGRSVLPTLLARVQKDGGRIRLLVLGRRANARATYLCARYNRKQFSSGPLCLYQCGGAELSGSDGSGLFWSDDASALDSVPDGYFDAVLCYNLNRDRRHVCLLMWRLQRVLRLGGCLAGTGLFAARSAKQRKPAGTSGALCRDRLALLGFRELVESIGMFVHTAIDMSLEGNVMLHLEQQDTGAVSLVRGGVLLCARYLATKERQVDELPDHAAEMLGSTLTPRVRKQNPQGQWGNALRHSSSMTNISSLSALPTSTVGAMSDSSPAGTAAAVLPPPISVQERHRNIVGVSSREFVRQAPQAAREHLQRLRESKQSSFSLPASASTSTSTTPTPTSPGKGVRVVVSGVSLGLPNGNEPGRRVFDSSNLDQLFRGKNFISRLSRQDKEAILSTNPFRVAKSADGARTKHFFKQHAEVIQLAGKIAQFDLSSEYELPPAIVASMDTAYQLALAAGIEALLDAGVRLAPGQTKDSRRPTRLALPEHMRDGTGVIFASSFPGVDSAVAEVTRKVTGTIAQELRLHRERCQCSCSSKKEEKPSSDSKVSEETGIRSTGDGVTPPGGPTITTEQFLSRLYDTKYEYGRKLLFKLLVMANSQLAELIKARGPNSQVNSACSGTSQAIAMAEDWVRTGRCDRVVVVAADNATSNNLLPYIGTGFLALGAASTVDTVSEAAVPFDLRRKGMILGAGAVGLVLESATACLRRRGRPRTELLASHFCNSAFHASLLDRQHIASEFRRFVGKVEQDYGIDRAELASELLYFSHETQTSAKGGCAKAERDMLEAGFGSALSQVLVANTKGFTGHPMGACLEDAVAVAALDRGLVPPIANHRQSDPGLTGLQLSRGGTHQRQYALRFAAGFGSQLVFLLYRKWTRQDSLGQMALLGLQEDPDHELVSPSESRAMLSLQTDRVLPPALGDFAEVDEEVMTLEL